MTDRERVLRRVEEGRATRAAELAAAVSSPVSLAVRLGAVHRDGARVFDPVTGQEGVVVGRASENIVIPAAK